jgi:glutamyl-tRNA synthetase
VRIEDTDRERLIPESLPKILEILDWLGITYDNHPPRVQSEHLKDYRQAAEELVEKGAAYYCFCTKEHLEQVHAERLKMHLPPRYDQHCAHLTKEEIAQKIKNNEPKIVRLKVPKNMELIWNDLIRGKISVNSNELDDQVLLKSDGFPTYHLAVVYDDNLMQITHVLRGAEWISSTPKHILLYEAFDYKKPEWGHVPLILGPDHAKLSKRHGAQSALEYRDAGYLPEALLNTLVFWGWTPKTDKQFLTMDEMIQEFDLIGINKNDPVVDLKKLDYFNGHYIREKSDEELYDLMYPYMSDKEKKWRREKILKIIPLIKDRLKKLSDWLELTKYFFEEPDVKQTASLLHTIDVACNVSMTQILQKILEYLKNPAVWENSDIWQTGLRKIANEFKIKHGDLFLRVCIWGDKITPPLFETMQVIGTKESLVRIDKIINCI